MEKQKGGDASDGDDMYYEQVINVHLEDIVVGMRASRVCILMPSLTSLEFIAELRDLEKSSSRTANIKFLQTLLNKKGNGPHWFSEFTNALKRADYNVLANRLEMKDIKCDEFGKQLLEIFFPDIIHSSDIDAKEVLLHLVQDKVIGRLNQDKIMHCHGIEALWELLLVLPQKREDWFLHFLHTLRKLKYRIGDEMISGIEGNSLSQLREKLSKMAAINSNKFNLEDEVLYKSDPEKLKKMEKEYGEAEHRMDYNVEGEACLNLYGANINGASNEKSFEKNIEAVENVRANEQNKMGVATVIRSCSNEQQQPDERARNVATNDLDVQNQQTRCKVFDAEFTRQQNRPPAEPGRSRVTRDESSPMRVDTVVDTDDIELNLQGPLDDESSGMTELYDLRSERGGATNRRSGASNDVTTPLTRSDNNSLSYQNQLSDNGSRQSNSNGAYVKPNIGKLAEASTQRKHENSGSEDIQYQHDTVFIHGLPLEASIDQIIDHFSMSGDIPLKKDSNGRPCAMLVQDVRTGGPNGSARLGFVDESLAQMVIEMFHDTSYLESKVQLEKSWKSRERTADSAPRRGNREPMRPILPADDEDGTTLTTENTADSISTQSSTSSESQPNPYVLELRSYQKELAKTAMEGKNCIIVAPTGSGKTHVALAITQRHFQKASYGDYPKVIFFVPTVALVEQQRQQFERYLPQYRCIGLSGDQDTKLPLSELLPLNSVFVMTPQILQNALSIKDIHSLSAFSLLIFDECHHATKSHTYNMIMGHYIDEMFSSGAADDLSDASSGVFDSRNSRLPQVVGLTASVGVGKSKSLAQAVDNVLRLCANMHAQYICTVRKNMEELLRHVNKPEEETTELHGRDPVKDPFNNIVSEIMTKIEDRMKASNEFIVEIESEGGGFRELLQAPRDRGSDRYTQWIHKLDKPVASIYRQEIRRFFVTCLQHLDFYNRALLINADCRTKDALEFLETNVIPSQIDYKPYSDETDMWLRKLFEYKKDYLHEMSVNPKYENPKLAHLRKIILQYYHAKPDSRGIIFCKTRDLTVALMNWMKATEGLKELHPHNLVGSNAPSNKFGMTQFRQEDVLRYFKDGGHKLIIATSVAEEGLDVQKCNFVIRYEHVTNTIARVQSRGRARDKDSKFVLVAERGRGTANKEECNKIRESLMMKAIDNINETREMEILSKIKTFQKEARVERQMASRGRHLSFMRGQAQLVQDEYEIRCHKCDSFAAFSRDIRKIEDSHHVIIDDDYSERITIRAHPDIRKKFVDFELTGKIYCKRCNWDWGIMALYKKVSFPVIKICSFILVDSKGVRNIYKRWKEVPFAVKALKPEDLEEKARRSAGSIDDDDDDDDNFDDWFSQPDSARSSMRDPLYSFQANYD